MRILQFNHPAYSKFKGYLVSSTGRVFHKETGEELNYHIDKRNKAGAGKFVRLSGGKYLTLTITVSRLMLLTFNPSGYKKGLLVIHKNGKREDTRLSNLIWGDRYCQGKSMMKNEIHRKRIVKMGKKTRFKTNKNE